MRGVLCLSLCLLVVPSVAHGESTGDINCDGMINVVDVQLTIMIALGLPISSVMDENGDNVPDNCPLPQESCGEGTTFDTLTGACVLSPEMTEKIASLEAANNALQEEVNQAYNNGYNAGLSDGAASVNPAALCVQGCTNEAAFNFDPDALVEDGSCVFSGCMDAAYDNFDPQATVDDGSCANFPEFAPCGSLDQAYAFTAGNQVSLQNCLANLGQVPAEATIRISLNGEVMGTNTWFTNPGDNISTGYPWTAVEGWHTVLWEVDSDNLVAETDESNNVLEVTFYVEPAPVGLPDFAPCASMATQNLNAVEGETVNIQGCLVNLGVVPETTTLKVTLNGEVIMQPEWFVNPGSNIATGYGWTAVPGEHMVRWEADPENQVLEEDENNNVTELTFFVEEKDPNAKPDFLPCSGLANPDNYNYTVGMQANLQVCLANQGTSADFGTISLFLDGDLLYSSGWNVNVGSNIATGALWIATPGTHHLKWVVDEAGEVDELDESNNELNVYFTVP